MNDILMDNAKNVVQIAKHAYLELDVFNVMMDISLLIRNVLL